MRISIIVPVYNAEQYLHECIDSLVGQTWKDIEIILVNDGSTDASGAICESYCSDSRVIYHYQDNAGVSAARNMGLSLARGEYICFVDSDDWLELDALERLQKETADIVIYNFYRGDKKHYELLIDGVYPKEALFPKMLGYVDESGEIAYPFHTIWMRLFKRNLIENNHIRFNSRYRNGEDLLFTFEATMKATTISVKCSEYLYHYRPVQNSATNRYIVNYWPLRKEIIEKMNDMIQDDILRRQMPLRVFSWAVTGIENEFRSPDGASDAIKSIVKDPICYIFRGKLDAERLNEKNRRYYQRICNKDYKGILQDKQREDFRRKIRRFIKRVKRAINKLWNEVQ